MNSLAHEFEDRLRAAIRQCITLGYHPHRFEQMLTAADGTTIAKRLVASGDLQDGLRRVAKMGRPDLSMESIMLEARFHPLFSAGELEAARWRLQEVISSDA